MAEMVSSAVVQETVNQIVSGVLKKYESREIPCADEQLERLEMAHIKLEATLETSEKWHITDASLLRWQKKLKQATQDSDETLRKCRQHLREQEVRNSSSFPTRFAHATKSFLSSIFYGNNKELSRSAAVRRFEWLADGASEFLRLVELGGTPRQYTFSDHLIRHLLAGKTLKYKSVQGNTRHLFCIQPFNVTERRTEAKLMFVCEDGSAPEDNFFLGMMLQLSESTDIVAIAIESLQLFTPYFKSTAEAIRKELAGLPTQDFSSVPYVYSCRTEHWENLNNICTRWFRPNAQCCKQRGLRKSCGTRNINMSELSDESLEPVYHVYLGCHVSPSKYGKQMTGIHIKRSSSKHFLNLKVVLLFMPHGSSEDHPMAASVQSSVTEVINGEEQGCLYTNITLEELDKIMLPKAMDCLHRNAELTTYQILWKSKHGNAYLHVAKKSVQAATKRRTIRGAQKEMMVQRQNQEEEMKSQTNEVCAFLNLWVAHAPVPIQGSIMEWIRKEKDSQLAN